MPGESDTNNASHSRGGEREWGEEPVGTGGYCLELPQTGHNQMATKKPSPEEWRISTIRSWMTLVQQDRNRPAGTFSGALELIFPASMAASVIGADCS